MPTPFYHVLLNNLVAGVVNFTLWFAITFFVYLETKSVFATSLIAGIFLALTAMTGFWFGSLVDRFNKRDVMIGSSVASASLYAVAFAIYQVVGRDTFRDPTSVALWAMVLVIMAGVITGNIRNIALSTVVTLLVPDDRRDRANGMVGTVSGVSFLITSVFSGLLVGFSGMFLPLLLAVVLTIAAIVHLLTLRVPSRPAGSVESGEPHHLDIRGTLAIMTAIPGLIALVGFTTINNFMSGALMALMDAYGLEKVSVEVWGILWGVLSTAFILGGFIISKWGLGKNPLRSMFLANLTIWVICTFFTVHPSIVPLFVGMFIFLAVMPFIEASEQTILQKVVPHERQGRVFGVAQSLEQSASPLTAFIIGPIAQFIVIPFMTDGVGAATIGAWWGHRHRPWYRPDFTVTGVLGFALTAYAFASPFYRRLSARYLESSRAEESNDAVRDAELVAV